jgi:hypothetical protein
VAIYISGDFSVTTTAAKIVESAECDRTVVLSTGSASVEVGYTSSTTAPLFLRTGGGNEIITLPAGYELWALSSGSTQALGVLVTVK